MTVPQVPGDAPRRDRDTTVANHVPGLDSSDDDSPGRNPEGDPHAVTVYWRPGCPFCSMLLSGLDALGVAYDMRNIWDDPEAAAFVRSVADGNETVPTVTVGSAAMVNPGPKQVLAALSP